MAEDRTTHGTIGAFSILGTLGEGASGTVYLAEQAPLGRRVALKVLHATTPPGAGAPTGSRAESRQRVESEAVAIGALRHPGIAGLIESGWTADGRHFLVIEFVDGPGLLRHADEAALSRPQRVELLARVCDAVDYAHRRGVVHGDLKPGNIRVDGTGAPKILDFEPLRPRRVGTPAYLAPEQARGAAATELSDVHALGLLLFELLTGRPARDVDGLAPLEALARAALPRQPGAGGSGDLHGDLRAIVDKATDDVPSQRYVSAAALADDLRRHVAALPIAARRVGLLARGLLFARRHRVPVALVSLVLASLSMALVLMLVFTQRADAATRELLRLHTDVDILSDEHVLDELEERARADLWPAMPERAPDMEAWLAEARRLDPQRDRIRTLLKGPDLAWEPAADAPFEAPMSGLLRGDFEVLLARLEACFDPARGLVAEIEARLSASLALPGRSIGDWSAEWQQCIDGVARAPLYGGLQLVPQVGLIPLGEDVLSHCWEFAVANTGERPLRDSSTGLLRAPRAEDAIVLVLVPGGVHRLWAEARFASRATARPTTAPEEYRLRAPPFLIGKYEVTQAQWLRLTGEKPSTFRPGWSTGSEPPVDGRHPVDNLTLDLAQDGLRRAGLIVPPVDLWEVAARGGAGLCGAELGIDALTCVANVSDSRARRTSLSPRTSPDQFLLDDGYEIHAPVGSFLPNGYGLHDTLGNVGELCTTSDPDREAATKGGSCFDVPMIVDPAGVKWVKRSDVGFGLRAARRLDDLGLPTEGVIVPATEDPAGDGR